jgi:hypothetical protein
MKALLLATLILCVSAARVPTVDLPMDLRQSNWRGSQGQGSCVYATTVSLLNWQGRYKTADWIKKNCGDGANPNDAARDFDRVNLRYAHTETGDVKFLEWSMRTRRGAGVVVGGGRHFVTLVHLDSKWAGIMDNNSTGKISWYTREAFLAEWKNSGGWALAVIYSPPAKLPI